MRYKCLGCKCELALIEVFPEGSLTTGKHFCRDCFVDNYHKLLKEVKHLKRKLKKVRH